MATYEELKSQVSDKYGMARSDVENAISQALETLTSAYSDVFTEIESMKASPNADAARMANLMAGPIRQEIDSLALELADYQQRGGRMGTTGVNQILGKSIQSLIPLTSTAVKEALGYQERVGLQQIGASERQGAAKAGLLESKGKQLAGLASGEAEGLSKIGAQELSEKAQLERLQAELQSKLTLAGMVNPLGLGTVAESAGLPNLALNQTGATGGSGTGTPSDINSLQNMISAYSAIREMAPTGYPGTTIPNYAEMAVNPNYAAYAGLIQAKKNLGNQIASATNPAYNNLSRTAKRY